VDDLVAETFAKVLEAVKAGRGPDAAFRPYLLTALAGVQILLNGGQHRADQRLQHREGTGRDREQEEGQFGARRAGRDVTGGRGDSAARQRTG
jgi:DNA-directed RNA polymerase specialized sigma24 family protein